MSEEVLDDEPIGLGWMLLGSMIVAGIVLMHIILPVCIAVSLCGVLILCHAPRELFYVVPFLGIVIAILFFAWSYRERSELTPGKLRLVRVVVWIAVTLVVAFTHVGYEPAVAILTGAPLSAIPHFPWITVASGVLTGLCIHLATVAVAARTESEEKEIFSKT